MGDEPDKSEDASFTVEEIDYLRWAFFCDDDKLNEPACLGPIKQELPSYGPDITVGGSQSKMSPSIHPSARPA